MTGRGAFEQSTPAVLRECSTQKEQPLQTGSAPVRGSEEASADRAQLLAGGKKKVDKVREVTGQRGGRSVHSLVDTAKTTTFL